MSDPEDSRTSPKLRLQMPGGFAVSANQQGMMQILALGGLIGIGFYLRDMWDEFVGRLDRIEASIAETERVYGEKIEALEATISRLDDRQELDEHAERIKLLENAVFAKVPTRRR